MLRRWGPPVVMVAVGVGLVFAMADTPVVAAIEGLVMLAAAGALSPLPFPRATSLAEAQLRSTADGAPVVLWRPGCQYCLRLRFRLGPAARRLHWVDIWHDPTAAAELRSHTGGDETVPTVLRDGEAHVNPDPAVVRGWAGDRSRRP